MRFDNSYVRDLPGFYAFCLPARAPAPRLLFVNRSLADELGIPLDDAGADELAHLFCGNRLPEGAQPIAQAYAGHQFGQFSPQLGDGRALVIGEIVDRQGRRRDLAFKGSGRTPFSRRGDGKAAVGPMLREAIVGEAMHALGIPTTRALAVVATGEPVYRERVLAGAVLTRVAASHLRVGTLEYFAAHGTREHIQKLADYTLARHYPEALGADQPYRALLEAVCERQAALVAQWMHVGFVHGVMNTDNMSLAGETIDYGPCAFLEHYDPRAVFSSIDDFGRYAYGAQPDIAAWNLARFAETVLPLLDDDENKAVAVATDLIESFAERFRRHWLAGLRAKLGLFDHDPAKDAADTALGHAWLDLLAAQVVDYTLAWRRLCDAAEGHDAGLKSLFSAPQALDRWLARLRARWQAEDAGQDRAALRAAAMRRVNPAIIPRNHRVEEALAAASEAGDLAPFEKLLAAVRQPYADFPELAPYAEPAPREFMACYRTFCGT